MPFAIGRHKVRDFESWKPVFDSDNERREAAGIRVVDLYRSMDDPNDVHFLFEIDDPNILRQMIDSPELSEKMREAGVISAPEFTLLERA
jgi:hypothetical protein